MEIALPDVDSLGLIERYLAGQLEHVADEFHTAIEQISRTIPELTRWEDDHLLDNPTPENLAAHKTRLERLLRFTQFAARTTREPTFLRPETVQMLDATIETLKLKLHMWHGPKMSPEESEKILAECFPNEPRA